MDFGNVQKTKRIKFVHSKKILKIVTHFKFVNLNSAQNLSRFK